MSDDDPAIGGHFSAFVETQANAPPGQFGFASARACLLAVLKSQKPKKVAIPNYICDAITDVVADYQADYYQYPINSAFDIDQPEKLDDCDLVLVNNYFGLSAEAVVRQLEKLSNTMTIVDCSQAYYQKPFDCFATFYSPRKFIPAPDGGFIHCEDTLAQEPADEQASVRRYGYLLDRIDCEPALSRPAYLQAEAELESVNLGAMSRLSRKIAETVDLEFIREARRKNYRELDRLLEGNRLHFELKDQVPLCYPFMHPQAQKIRSGLLAQRVFTPIYWANIRSLNEFEHDLSENTLYLPIDHRYSIKDMQKIAGLIHTQL